MKLTIFTVAIFSTVFGFSQIMTNQSVVDLVDLGFESEVIISKINSTETDFIVEVEALKELKERGVSSEILALMIEKSTENAKIQTGIYYVVEEKKIKVEPNIFSGTRSSALGSSLTYGIASAKMKSYVSGATSNNQIEDPKVEFYFHFDTEKANDLGANNWWFKTASSPQEFVLTKLKQKQSKGERELMTGKVNGITASSQFGVDSKNTIEFKFEDQGNGVYKVTFEEKLETGEYCFFYQGTIPMGGFSNQSIFDFTIN